MHWHHVAGPYAVYIMLQDHMQQLHNYVYMLRDHTHHGVIFVCAGPYALLQLFFAGPNASPVFTYYMALHIFVHCYFVQHQSLSFHAT